MEILYIEDDMIDQMILKRALRGDQAITYKIASDLKEAERLIQSHHFDFILSDFYLPGATIEDVLLQFKDFPIFLLSSVDDKCTLETLSKNGLKGHFKKPFSLEILEKIRLKGEKINQGSLPNSAVSDFKAPIIFDFSFLEKVSKCKPNVKFEFIKIFIELGAKEHIYLEDFLLKRDWEGIRNVTHKLKSIFRMMGLEQLLKKAGEIEIICTEATNLAVVEKELPLFLSRLKKAVDIAKKIN